MGDPDFVVTFDRPVPLYVFAGVLKGIAEFYPKATYEGRGGLSFAIKLGERSYEDRDELAESGGDPT